MHAVRRGRGAAARTVGNQRDKEQRMKPAWLTGLVTGLAVCLAESAFLGDRKPGCSIDLGDRIRPDALLFGETQSRIVVTASPRRAAPPRPL